jgi:hypothetical protein
MTTATLTAPGTTRAARVGRILSGLLVAFLLFNGVFKMLKPPVIVEGFAQFGIPESAITVIAAALLASTILYAIPATAVLGAILLTGYFGGAIMTHLRVGDPPGTIAVGALFGVLVWLGLFLREPRLRALIPFRRAG